MKLLIVDDHLVLREGLIALLRQLGPDTEILEAGDAPAAIQPVKEHADLDVVVLDLLMPGMGGLLAIAEFGRSRPDLPVIVLSSSENPQDARRALAHGRRQESNNLTEHQIEVLRRLCEGQANKTIVFELDLSEKSVKAHITAIFKALNVVNRTQAAAVAQEVGLV